MCPKTWYVVILKHFPHNWPIMPVTVVFPAQMTSNTEILCFVWYRKQASADEMRHINAQLIHPSFLTISKPYCGYYGIFLVDLSHTHFHFIVVFGHLYSYQKSHIYVSFRNQCLYHKEYTHVSTQIARFMGPTWDPPGCCRPQMSPMLAPWTLLSG